MCCPKQASACLCSGSRELKHIQCKNKKSNTQRHYSFYGRSEEARTPDILTSCHLRCPKLFARCSLRTILTATPTNAPFIVHRTRSRVLPKAGKRLFVFRMSELKPIHYKKIKVPTEWLKLLFGRSEEARTPDILLPKQARYQLRYTPM